MTLSRRAFLRASVAGAAALALPLPARRAFAAPTNGVLVTIFLRGGADGMHLVPPLLDPAYYDLRPGVAVPAAETTPIHADFGLNRALPRLAERYQDSQLAILHAVGSPDPNRSHFAAQDMVQRGSPFDRSQLDGWLNRYLALEGGSDPLAGVSFGSAREPSLEGSAPNLQLSTVSDYALAGHCCTDRRAALSALHAVPGLLSDRADVALETLDRVARAQPSPASAYPDFALARQLRQIAAMIRADVGVCVAAAHQEGWDTHSEQSVRLDLQMEELDASLAAFQDDLGSDVWRVVTLVMTEFGRSALENGSGGTDHGRGSVLFALGPFVRGGQLLLDGGAWPSLDDTDPWRDLPVTTDFRDALSEVAARHLGLANPGRLFPGFQSDPARYPGLMLEGAA